MKCHNRSHVSAAIAVVRRRPDSDQLLVKHVLVTFLYQLMCTSDKGKRIDVVELRGYEIEEVGDGSGVQTSFTTLPPNSHPAPRGLTAQLSMSSGSDHIRSTVLGNEKGDRFRA